MNLQTEKPPSPTLRMSYCGEVGDVVEIGRGDGEISSFEWRIPDFLSLDGEVGDRYASPSFHAYDGCWYFEIHWNGLSRDLPPNWVDIFLNREDSGLPKTLDVTLGIRGPEGVEKKKGRRQEFSDDDACFWHTFCWNWELTHQNSRLMPGNVLILSLDMQIVVPRAVRDSSTQTVEESKEAEDSSEENQSSEKQGSEKALDDFGKLLASGENSDITVQVGDAEFKAHKLILSTRCQVLAAMFKHETEEKVTNRITISDCLPDVFRDFLHYLYTGSVHSLTQQNVFGLYRTADKYLADDLKQQCLQRIRDTLSVQTFCETVKLALMHEESDLLQQAIDFATQNLPSIICTVEWQSFIREYPTEANEILIKCICPRS